MAEIIVVGGGAAGLFATGLCLRLGHGVTLVEHMERWGKKLAITGKGRCNLTNHCDEATFMQNICRNGKFLYSAIHAFSPQMAMDFFSAELGLPLVEERGRRVFPASQRGEDVVKTLVEFADRCKKVRGQARELLLDEGRVTGVRLADGRKLFAERVFLATGGVSYPVTGSTGLGHKMAAGAGHHITPLVPSLVSLKEKGNICKKMAGLSLKNVKLSLFEGENCLFADQGELLFTHFGLSGPLVLSASAYIGDMERKGYEISLDLKPALGREQLEARIMRDFAEMANRSAANCLDKLLPASMRPVMLGLWGVEQGKRVNQITREERGALVGLMKDLRIAIAQRGDLSHAVVTRGGVDVKQVNPKTMESKLVTGLHFMGEILDVDGYTGGYNLQIAWCTAWAAARAVHQVVE